MKNNFIKYVILSLGVFTTFQVTALSNEDECIGNSSGSSLRDFRVDVEALISLNQEGLNTTYYTTTVSNANNKIYLQFYAPAHFKGYIR